MAFFKQFNTLLYDADGNGIRRQAVNIFNSIIVKYDQIDNVTLYFYHMIEDGERPEDVAYRFYGDSDLNWVILLINSIVNPYYDWPLTQQELSSYTASKYENPTGIHHFVDLNTGYRVDEVSHIEYQDLIDSSSPLPANIGIVTNMEYEFEQNTEKRQIKILDRTHLNDFVIQFERLMKRKILNVEDV